MNAHHADLRLVGGTRGEFHSWLRDQGYSPRTAASYARAAGRCARHLREHRAGVTLGRAKTDDLYDFWTSLPPTRGSRNLVRSALVAYYHYRGRKDGGPAAELPNIPEPITLPRARDEADHDAFTAAARELGGDHAAIGALFAYTGCRIIELENARWHQFDLYSSSPSWYVEGKGSRRRGPKIRRVELCDSALTAVLTWRLQCRSADWLFPSTYSRTGHLGQTTLRRRVADICEAAGIDPATPHVWRHTVATILLDRSRDIRALQEYLGHEDLSTTQKYTKVLPGRQRAMVNTLDDREAS